MTGLVVQHLVWLARPQLREGSCGLASQTIQHRDLVPIHWVVCFPGMLCQCRGGYFAWLHRLPVLTQPLVKTSALSTWQDIWHWGLGRQHPSALCWWYNPFVSLKGVSVLCRDGRRPWHPVGWGCNTAPLTPPHIGQCDHWALCVTSIHCLEFNCIELQCITPLG